MVQMARESHEFIGIDDDREVYNMLAAFGLQNLGMRMVSCDGKYADECTIEEMVKMFDLGWCVISKDGRALGWKEEFRG